MAITQNWLYPATGAVSPAAGAVSQQSEVVVTITTDGTLTTFPLVHNLGISAADLLSGFPDIIVESNATNFYGSGTFSITSKLANQFTLTFAAVVTTFTLKITRPNTFTR